MWGQPGASSVPGKAAKGAGVWGCLPALGDSASVEGQGVAEFLCFQVLNLRGLVGNEEAFVGDEEHSRSTSSCSHGEPCLQGANISVAGTG